VLDCSTEKIFEVLKQAQQIGMMSDYHSYLITSLDLHTVNLEPFQYGGTNITAFRLVDPDNTLVRQTVKNWTTTDAKPKSRTSSLAYDNTSVIKAETALMYDAVHLFAKALHDLDTSQQIDIHPLSCDNQDTWRKLLHICYPHKAIQPSQLIASISIRKQHTAIVSSTT